MRYKIIIVFAFLFSTHAFSQSIEKEINTSLKEKGKLFLRFDTKNSFITNSKVKIFGVNLGLNHNNTIKYGIGFHSILFSPVHKTFNITDENNEIKEIKTKLHFNYVSVFGEYVFYKTKHWEGSLPIQLGFGNSYYKSTKPFQKKLFFYKKFTIHYEATLIWQYKFLRYFSLGAGVGYRIMIIDNKNLDERLTNPIYTVKFKFLIGDLFHDTVNLFH